MLAVLNVSNVLMIFIFCITFTVSMINFLLYKKDVFLYVGLMFIVFIADLTVISLTENVPWFRAMYDSNFLSVPTWKTLVYACFFLSVIVAVPKVFGFERKKYPFVVLGALVLYMLFIPMMDDGALKSWLYYEPNQVFMFAIGVNLMIQARKSRALHLDERMKRSLWVVGALFAVFAVAILLEDTYVIFFVDNYENAIYINNRSFSEDVFRVVIAVCLIWYEYRYLCDHMYTNVDEGEIVAVAEEGAEKYSKFFSYCKQYQLTIREQEILELLVVGKKTQEIADGLQISVGTAKTHIHNIFSKVGVSRRSMLIKNYDDYSADEFTLRKINEMWG